MLVIEIAAVCASLAFEISLVFAEYVHANRVVVVFRYWAQQLHNINLSEIKPRGVVGSASVEVRGRSRRIFEIYAF